jgi:hypothetical protein
VRWLVVDSSFPYVKIAHYNFTNTLGTSFYSAVPIINTYFTPFPITSSNIFVPVFSGIDFLETSAVWDTGVRVTLLYLTTSSIRITFDNSIAYTMKGYRFYLDIIVYQKNEFQIDYGATFLTGVTSSWTTTVNLSVAP